MLVKCIAIFVPTKKKERKTNQSLFSYEEEIRTISRSINYKMDCNVMEVCERKSYVEYSAKLTL